MKYRVVTEDGVFYYIEYKAWYWPWWTKVEYYFPCEPLLSIEQAVERIERWTKPVEKKVVWVGNSGG